MSDGPVETPTISTEDSGTENSQQEEVSSPGESSQPEPASNGNPAWAPILEVLPSSLHSVVRPELEKWDKGVNERFRKIHEEYEPLKSYKERGIAPDRIDSSLRLAELVDQDPVGFYNRLGEWARSQGLLEEAQAAEEAAEEAEESEEQGQEFKDPRLDTFMENLEKAKADFEQQQAQQEADRRIDAELVEVEKLHGKPLGDKLTQEVFLRAQAMYDMAMQAGKPLPSLVDAYNAQMAFLTEWAKIQTSSPSVIPASGGQAVPQTTDPSKFVDDDNARRKAAADVIKRMRS